MQVSPEQLNKSIEKQVFGLLYQVIADVNKPDQAKEIVSDLLSKTEREMMAKRLAVAMFLDKHRSYENIRQALKVSSATVARVQKQMSDPGMQLALRMAKADEWADKWSKKIRGVLKIK